MTAYAAHTLTLKCGHTIKFDARVDYQPKRSKGKLKGNLISPLYCADCGKPQPVVTHHVGALDRELPW